MAGCNSNKKTRKLTDPFEPLNSSLSTFSGGAVALPFNISPVSIASKFKDDGMDRIPLIHTTTAKQALNNKPNCATSHTEQEQQGTEKKRTHFSFSKTLPQQAAKGTSFPLSWLLCKNCGVSSNNPSACTSCGRPMHFSTGTSMLNAMVHSAGKNNAFANSSNTQILFPVRARTTVSTSNMNASKSKLGGAEDFTRFISSYENTTSLKVKRKRTVVPRDSLQTKPDCITISDSSDEELDPDSKPNSSNTSQCSVDQLSNGTTTGNLTRIENSVSPLSSKKPKECPSNQCSRNCVAAQGTSGPRTLITTAKKLCFQEQSQWQFQAITVHLKSIRFGQYHNKKGTDLRVSETDMRMCSEPYIIRIHWYGVEKLELHSDTEDPCMFVFVKTDYVSTLRNQLRMEPGKTHYFDPGGADDEKFIVFFIDAAWWVNGRSKLKGKIDLIRAKQKQNSNFFRELRTDEATMRLTNIAQAELFRSPRNPPRTPTTIAMNTVIVACTTASPRQRITSVPPTPERALTRVTRCRLLKLASAPPAKNSSESIIFHPPFSGPRIELAIFPAPPAKGGISVTNEDQFCLNDGEFLNDVIIDFYLKYIMEKLLNEKDRERSHVFSCFFYKRFTQAAFGKMKQQEDKSLTLAERRYKRVQKWTRGVDIFSKDFIFVPINEASHWFLAVICFPRLNGLECVDIATNQPVDLCNSTQPGDSIVVKRTHALSSIEAYNDQDESMDSTMETLAVSSSSANNSEIKSENTSSPMEIDGATNDGLEIDTSTSSSSGTPGPTWSIVINSGSLENNDTHEKESNSVPGTPSVVPSENIPDDFISETWTVDEDSRKGRKQDVKCADRLCSNVGDTIRESVSKASAQHNGNQILCSGQVNSPPTPDRLQCRQPCILLFDSLRGPSRGKTAQHLRDYLNMEWKSKKEKQCGPKVFNKNTIKTRSLAVPQQDNYSDCGIFLLKYVEQMFKKPIKHFVFPIKDVENWFDPSECKQKRTDIYNIIQKLHEEQSAKKEGN